MIHGLGADIRHALRQVRWHPGLALVVVLTLGGAIAVSTSVFSVFNNMALRPWSVRDPATVATIRPAVPPDEWEHWSRHSRMFRALVATRSGGFARLGGRRATYDLVSARYFEVLGVSMARGRAFTDEDDAGRLAILSHRTWESRFASDPEILGRTISLEGVPFVVVGVARRGFEGPDHIRKDLWLPLAAEARLHAKPTRGDGTWALSVAGRLAPGVSRAQAEGELAVLSRAFRLERGQAVAPIRVRGTARYAYAPPPPQTWMAWQSTLIGVTFITLVACANIANLMLARGHARRREIAVRLSMGATRARLIRQLLVEAFVLAAAAGGLGLVLSRMALGAQAVDVLRAVFEPTVRALGRGLAIGGLGGVGVGLFMARADLPAGIDPLDGVTYLAVALVMGFAALAAAWLPGRQAMRLSPTEALRCE